MKCPLCPDSASFYCYNYKSYTMNNVINDYLDPAEMTEEERTRILYEADYNMPSNQIYELLPEDLLSEF
jgi:hypothetical protein